MEITESVRCWVKHSLGPQKKPAEGKVTGHWNDRSPETGEITSGDNRKILQICSVDKFTLSFFYSAILPC